MPPRRLLRVDIYIYIYTHYYIILYVYIRYTYIYFTTYNIMYRYTCVCVCVCLIRPVILGTFNNFIYPHIRTPTYTRAGLRVAVLLYGYFFNL